MYLASGIIKLGYHAMWFTPKTLSLILSLYFFKLVIFLISVTLLMPYLVYASQIKYIFDYYSDLVWT